MNNEKRAGRVTSSKIHLLCSKPRSKSEVFTKGAMTYLQKKRGEKVLKRTLDSGGYSQATAWGIFMENVVFHILGMEWSIHSQETNTHPDPEFKDFWAGSRDLIVPNKKVGEIKAYGLEKGIMYADCLMKKNIELFKKEFAQEYWQIVSNAIIEQTDYGEAILYIPYYSEMAEIQEMASDLDGLESWKYRFIAERDMSELPCIPDDNGVYSNITSFEFEIPLEDILFLEERVRKAKPFLNIDYGKTK